MKIGITGTREGMNQKQAKQVYEFLSQFPAGTEFHHGDCKGVDCQAALIAKHLGFKIICHPPISPETQGHFGGDEVREKRGYLERDRDIVNETDILIVVPKEDEWQKKGGTWYTHDYAVKKGKPITIFYPTR